ncbi:MAG: hypothetical protein HYV42_01060 [Candidatus Magasanikbacteria bacterium]|nr:hypothetical protein [Candidatus Magasanikbacteria bacterium]
MATPNRIAIVVFSCLVCFVASVYGQSVPAEVRPAIPRHVTVAAGIKAHCQWGPGEVPTAAQCRCQSDQFPAVIGTADRNNLNAQTDLEWRRAQAMAPADWDGEWAMVIRTSLIGRGGGWCAPRSILPLEKGGSGYKEEGGYKLLDEDRGGGGSRAGPGGAPSCHDGIKNGAETDVDCGGSDCRGCVQCQLCLTTTDCKAGLSCADGNCGGCGPAGASAGPVWKKSWFGVGTSLVIAAEGGFTGAVNSSDAPFRRLDGRTDSTAYGWTGRLFLGVGIDNPKLSGYFLAGAGIGESVTEPGGGFTIAGAVGLGSRVHPRVVVGGYGDFSLDLLLQERGIRTTTAGIGPELIVILHRMVELSVRGGVALAWDYRSNPTFFVGYEGWGAFRLRLPGLEE